MSLLIEFVLEVVFELIINGIASGLTRSGGTGGPSRTFRAVTSTLVAAVAGFAGGYWWGWRLSQGEREATPRTMYVSIGLALFFALAAYMAHRKRAPAFDIGQQTLAEPRIGRVAEFWTSPTRLLTLAVLNAAVAIGVTVGFTPYVAA